MSYLKAVQNIAVCLSANAHWDLKPPFWLLSFSGVTLAASSHCPPESCRDRFFPLSSFHTDFHGADSPPQQLCSSCLTGEKICLYLIFLAIKNAKGGCWVPSYPRASFSSPLIKGNQNHLWFSWQVRGISQLGRAGASWLLFQLGAEELHILSLPLSAKLPRSSAQIIPSLAIYCSSFL